MGKRLTAEQRAVVEAVGCGEDVVVQACAGSGKTTTIRAIVSKARAPVLILTFNKQLQLEMQELVRAPHEVLTFHAAAGRFFGETVRDDSQLYGKLEAFERAGGEACGEAGGAARGGGPAAV